MFKQGQQATAEELQRFVAEACAKWWVPDAVVFLESLPKTGTGKFMKTTLRQRFEDHYGGR